MPNRNHMFKKADSVRLLRSGYEYFSRLEQVIDEARYSIHIQVYIFDPDKTGTIIMDKLIAAAQRGVAVYLVIDGYASPHLNKGIIKNLTSAGIAVKRFAPFHYKSLKIGRRLHHKIVLADEQIAIIGGINIADKYSGYHSKLPWLDVAIEMEGKICEDVKAICNSIWPKRVRRKWERKVIPGVEHSDTIEISVAQNDWWRRKIEISKTYRDMIRTSKSDLFIMASYFLPGFRKRLLLKKAAERGVKISMILGGMSDIPFFKPARHYLYSVLCKHEITIYEWNKSVLHGKMAIADGHLTTIGSYNLNALSDYGSLELNVNVESNVFAKSSADFLQEIITEGCVKINPSNYLHKSFSIIHLYRFLCFQSLRFSLFILFVMMRRDRMSHRHQA